MYIRGAVTQALRITDFREIFNRLCIRTPISRCPFYL
uniref:Uncharacterized protein n=1 Tax=Siphoviridae sp. ctpoI7 TaxID=2825678 RepID=A0A8S5PA41_9CAUD|nr:MAG TPA: hypothetical protein [Siphoviridae sp. ctpoI7]